MRAPTITENSPGLTGGSPPPPTEPVRRAPVQERSRRRVEAILDGAERAVLRVGVDHVTTREIADDAGVPVASLYQYFADKEAVLLALVQRDMAEMDAEVARRLDPASGLPTSLAGLVETTMRAFVAVYLRRPAFVEIYLRGRANPAVRDFGRAHNGRVAATLRGYAVDAGLAPGDLPAAVATLAVEVGDRIFQLAFENDPAGDPVLLDEGIAMVTAYLERHAR